MFPVLGQRRKQVAGTLSGGEQQMLAIGRALMSAPRLVLFDEPSLGLAPNIVGRTFEIIKNIQAEGTTVLMVEQNAYAALETTIRTSAARISAGDSIGMKTGRSTRDGAGSHHP
jgi:branched-chain amino acid transport system ATP-binding protein